MARKLVKASDLRKMEKALRKTHKNFRTVMRLARLARDEAEALAKKGVKVDERALKKIIYKPSVLLNARTNANVRALVRSVSAIDVGNVEVNYQKYITAKKAIDRFNKSVRGFNLYHKAEIEAGEIEARREKKWTIGTPADTTESINRWLDTAIDIYSPKSEYQETVRQNYIHNLLRAIERTTPVGMDYIIDFFRDQLNKHVEYNMEWYTSVSYVYRPEDIITIYKNIAKHYNFSDEWNDLVREHSEDFKSVYALISY